MKDQNESTVHKKIQDIWRSTCGSWENCNESTIQSFFSECEKNSIDPQACLSWIQQHNDTIPNWSAVSDIAREWVIEHTSTGSPISDSEENNR